MEFVTKIKLRNGSWKKNEIDDPDKIFPLKMNYSLFNNKCYGNITRL